VEQKTRNTDEDTGYNDDEIEMTESDWRQFEADFEMAVDMFEFGLAEKGRNLPDIDEDNVLERFKKSDYPSARRFTL